MKVVIAGGTGFLGRATSDALLSKGHQVTLLTRRPSSVSSRGIPERLWTPDGTAGDWAEVVDGADGVINLAGESIAAGRWTEARRAGIRDSRVRATRSITEAILRAARAPRVLINGSAQGYYGDRGDEELTEESPPGSDFLARVCVDWELEARRASPASRVVLLRTAIVLDRASGALPRMIQPFKFFAGGPLGSGKQFWSWIHLDDWVALALLPLSDERVHGPVNLGSPHPVTNAEFTAAIGQVLHRPGWFRAPSIALRAGLGEMADALLLSSTRMKPAQALGLGYRFRYPELVPALEAVLRERQASSVRH